MTKQVIIHAVHVLDGSGDLLYFLHWLKIFNNNYNGNIEQRILIISDEPNWIKKYLLELVKVEPSHPVFDFIDTTNANGKRKNDVLIGHIESILPYDSPGESPVNFLDRCFSDVKQGYKIKLISISGDCSNYFSIQDIPDITKNIEKIGIYELDTLPSVLKGPFISSLGLNDNDFGLLYDLDEPYDQPLDKMLDTHFTLLSADLKERMFEDKNITKERAREFLKKTPIVFAHLNIDYTEDILSMVLQSSLIQNAIKSGIKPFFLITGHFEGRSLLPMTLMEYIFTNKIKGVVKDLEAQDYNAMNAILMNKESISLVLPSGDNGVMKCILYGKFPLYIHRQLDNIPDHLQSFSRQFKYGIFKAMLSILYKHGLNAEWNKYPGYTACCKALEILATHVSERNAEHYSAVSKIIDANCIDFFRDILSPYLVEKYSFQNKTLPALLEKIMAQETITAEPTITNCFDSYRDAKRLKQESTESIAPVLEECTNTAACQIKLNVTMN